MPGSPGDGYYNDLRVEIRARSPEEAVERVAKLGRAREKLNHVDLAQLGLGAWQLSATEPGWREVVARAAERLAGHLDSAGRLAFEFPMPHTYRIEPPWYSAMAQGEAASLFVRAAATLAEPAFLAAAIRAVDPLLSPSSPLVVETDEGPVLQEYPTEPPAHVLNGWVFALWGLYDVQAAASRAQNGSQPEKTAEIRSAFERGAAALARRLPLYDTSRNWSRYDLYPHPVAHVASPFYHRLHIEQLAAMYELVPDEAFRAKARRWEAGAASRSARASAVVRKLAFRALRPRRRVT